VLLVREKLSTEHTQKVKKFDHDFAHICAGLSPQTCVNDLTASLNIGDEINPIMNAACTSNFHKKNLEFEKGKVHILIFWATFAEPCGPALDFISKMMRKHPEWSDKVQVRGVVMDKEHPEMIHPHIETFEFDNIEHVLLAQSNANI